MPYLIDGHNVIAALPDISLEDDDDEAQLIIKLRSWLTSIRRKAVVIFDGGIAGGPSTGLSSNDIQVIFAARQYTIADAIIIERVKHLPDPGNWTVISSDREVIERAEMAGARTMTAQSFAEFLQQQLTIDKEKPEGLVAGELDHWLDIFPEVKEKPAPGPKPNPTTHRTRKRTVRTPENQPPSMPTQPKTSTTTPAKPAQSHKGSSIGHQIGYTDITDEEPVAPKRVRSEKPQESSDEEIEAWLEVFKEPERSYIPPPNLPKRKKKKPSAAKPVIRKSGELSEGEVDAWLQVFGPEAESIAAEAPPTTLKPKKRKISSTLAKHQENLTPLQQKNGDGTLSEDDLDMWYRMFGRDDE